jgi:phage terminase small subunit
MPKLKNARWETFAQEIIKGATNRQAYVAAGYKAAAGPSLDACASGLLSSPKVSERVAELQGRAAKNAVVTLESLIAEVEEARQLAIAINQPSAAVAAIREKGVLSGKRIERAERGLPGEFADLEAMKPDELRSYLAAESEALSLRKAALNGSGGAGKPH